MQSNTALIVDDSVTARLVLRRMLEQQDYQVEMVESGEEALVFLRNNRPGIIFMDHMMPGMDGFQAVKAIKSTPEISAIPIVMYTSQAGGVYVGQAHALGAVDILSKPPVRAELKAIFERLAANEEIKPAAAPPEQGGAGQANGAEYQLLNELSDEALEETGEVATEELESAAEEVNAEPVVRQPATTPWWKRYWLAGLLLIALVAVSIAWQRLHTDYLALQARQQQYTETVEWAVNQNLEYGYGEQAFAGDRLQVLQELVSQLSLLEFRGRIVLEQHAGEFCKMVTADGEWMLPPAEFPIIACDAIGGDEPVAGESVAFSNFLRNSPLLGPGGIQVELVNLGTRSPYYEYPSEDRVRTVGDWNRIASRNNHVQLRIIPQP
jgi:CheY-like chemotaxis protein